MDQCCSTGQPDSAFLCSRHANYHLVYTLSTSLPPPVRDTPANRPRRDAAAIAQVAVLCLVNTSEASLAAQYVAGQAMACLRQSRDPALGPDRAARCAALAASMVRRAEGAMRLLPRAQSVRTKRDAVLQTTDTAAWSEYRAAEQIAEALTAGEQHPVTLSDWLVADTAPVDRPRESETGGPCDPLLREAATGTATSVRPVCTGVRRSDPAARIVSCSQRCPAEPHLHPRHGGRMDEAIRSSGHARLAVPGSTQPMASARPPFLPGGPAARRPRRPRQGGAPRSTDKSVARILP